jgi:hypothetical protein
MALRFLIFFQRVRRISWYTPLLYFKASLSTHAHCLIGAYAGSSMIFIAHDLSVVRFFSDHIAVMYLGQIVEVGLAGKLIFYVNLEEKVSSLAVIQFPSQPGKPEFGSVRSSGRDD